MPIKSIFYLLSVLKISIFKRSVRFSKAPVTLFTFSGYLNNLPIKPARLSALTSNVISEVMLFVISMTDRVLIGETILFYAVNSPVTSTSKLDN